MSPPRLVQILRDRNRGRTAFGMLCGRISVSKLQVSNTCDLILVYFQAAVVIVLLPWISGELRAVVQFSVAISGSHVMSNCDVDLAPVSESLTHCSGNAPHEFSRREWFLLI